MMSTWLTPCSAESASCPAEVKCSLVLFSAPLYCHFMVLWSVLAVLTHAVAIREVGPGLCCRGPTSLGPNTSSALICKYHQQLVAHKLVVLNKLLAYMWRGRELHLSLCQESGHAITICNKQVYSKSIIRLICVKMMMKMILLRTNR